MPYDARQAGAACDKCPLAGRHTPVPPSPPKSGKVRLVIVGEGPGGMEKFRGVPFVGPSGMLLDKMLARAGFSRDDAWITNSALCQGYTEIEKERAAACCSMRLANELKDLPSEVPTLAFGNVASFQLLGRKSILKSRGFMWKSLDITDKHIKAANAKLSKVIKQYGTGPFVMRAENSVMRLKARQVLGTGHVVIPTVHPAMILRGADGYTSTLFTDLKRAVDYSKSPLADEADEPFAETSNPDEARDLLAKLGPVVAVDTETNGIDVFRDKLLCVQISDGTRDGTVVLNPWHLGLAQVLDEALHVRVVVTHNGPAFDDLVMIRNGVDIIGAGYDILGERLGEYEDLEDVAQFAALGFKRLHADNPTKRDDTLIGFHGFASHLKKGLGNVVAFYCNTSPWKLDFKEAGAEDKGGVAKKQLWDKDNKDLVKYGAADARLTKRGWDGMQADMRSERHVYEHDMKLAYVCQQMMVNGMGIDENRRDELSGKLAVREAELLTQMRALVGDPAFEPGKPVHVRKALFSTLGGRILKTTKTGLAHTGAETLEAYKTLNTPVGQLSALILRWRAAAKTRSTFVDGVAIGPDGRVHPNWRSFGTVTGRLGCRAPNLMNLTRAVLSEAAAKGMKELVKAGTKPGDAAKQVKKQLGGDFYELETRVRELYVARPGHVLIYFDLSQSEMRFAAYASGDPNFIASCESGDVHTANACILFPEAREILLADPKGRGKKFRDVTKNAGFGIIYLAEISTIYAFLCAAGFAADLPYGQQTVEAMFAHIYQHYARYYEFCAERVAEARQKGYLRTLLLGRKRWVGRRQSQDDEKGYENKIANFSVQSGIADLMNMRLIEMVPKLPPGARLVAQIHDACIFEAKCGEAERLTEDLIKSTWAQEVVMPSGIRWVMPIDFKKADRWSELG